MDREIIYIEDIEMLEAMILDRLETEEAISVVSDFDFIWDLAMQLHLVDEIEFEYIDVCRYDYDKEYILSVLDDGDKYVMSIEKAFNYANNSYSGIDGVVFVDDSASSRVITDMENNEYCKPEFILFSRDPADKECCDCSLERETDEHRIVYYIPSCFDYLIDSIDKMIDDFVIDWF